MYSAILMFDSVGKSEHTLLMHMPNQQATETRLFQVDVVGAKTQKTTSAKLDLLGGIF